MQGRHFLAACTLLALSAAASGAAAVTERPDWSTFFTRAEARGTIVVVDARPSPEHTFVFNPARAAQRFSPASTFKIPHSLFALEAGILRDEFDRIAWDGVVRDTPAWNMDQDLRSAMRYSTVWVYERFARQLGDARENDYLQRSAYGNARTGGVPLFWLDGDLAISAHEQIAFLRRLYANTLPFRVEHQRLVKDVMVNEAGYDWILRAKTGWTGKMGWWVGWVEWPTGPVFFALNLDTPNRLADLAKRKDITRAILRSLAALPEGS